MKSIDTQKKINLIQILVFISLSINSHSASAMDIRGFGSTGLIQTNTNLALSEYGTPDHKPNFSGMTLLGLNFHQNINSDWAASAQFIANNLDKDFKTMLEWGFISYKPTQNISIRTGRLVIPAWLNSEQLNVGYNYPWVYLPTEVYSLNPFHSFNGLSLTSQMELGPGVLEGNVFVGDGTLTVGGYLQGQSTTSIGKASEVLGGEILYNIKEIILARLGYFETIGSVNTKAPFTLPAGSLGPNQSVPLTLDSNTKTDLGLCRFYSAGLKVEQNNIMFAGEFVRRLFESGAFRQASGFYSSIGYRYNKWMPLYTYSWQGGLSGSQYFHPDFPTVQAQLSSKHSSTFGLDYFMTDFVVLKGSVSLTQQSFSDSSQNIKPTVYALTANFIF